MTLRRKAGLLIIAIVAFITAASTVIGITFSRSSMIDTISHNLIVIGDIANKLVSANIKLLKSEADVVSATCLQAAVADAGKPEAEWTLPDVMRGEARKRGYLSMTVIDQKGVVAQVGGSAPTDDFVRGDLVARAMKGERVISSTHFAKDGQLVLFVCVPMGSRVLCVALPGLYFNDVLANFRIWQTGNIFMLDKEGYTLSNPRVRLVKERFNFVISEESSVDDFVRSGSRFFAQMVSGDGTGVGQYTLSDAGLRICAYVQVPGTDQWMLGAAASINESPEAKIVWALMLSAALFLAMGIVCAVIASGYIARPFKLLSENNERLTLLTQKAEAANHAKSNFLSNMSHEMRTPLNAITGMVAVARGTTDAARKEDCYGKIESASRHLIGLINDILDMSKIEAGKFELSYIMFDMQKALEEAAGLAEYRLTQKNIAFNTDIGDMPAAVVGDDQRISQVVTNLLSNAAKFTPEGGSVSLKSFVAETDGDYAVIQTEVADSGIGITAEQREKLFGSFVQADSDISRKYGGTGLGLAISKQIVEMMGGHIWITSEPGKGSVFSFTVRLKAAAAETEEQPTEDEGEANNDFTGFRALLAEDVALNREIVLAVLEPTNLTIDCAENGAQAVSLFTENGGAYDIILMDMQMPEVDGIEATKRIRASNVPGAGAVPIIAMTANVFTEDIEACLLAGMNGHIGKPIDFERLLEILRAVLLQKQGGIL